MEYTNQAIDFSEQIKVLKARGMLFKDERLALRQLGSISYFRLAIYWHSMEQDSVSHKFFPETRFEDVVSLYLFDKRLRSLIFAAIQDVEIALRTRVIHHFSMKHGAFWFLNRDLFKDKLIYDNCLANIKSELGRSKEDFIQEHFSKYSSPPFPPAWKTLEVVSFGTLSKLYCNMQDAEVKKLVAKDFYLPQYPFLENWIKCACVLRNYCAHHARLWNRRFPLIPKLPQSLPLTWIANRDVRPIKLYAQLCYLAYMEQSINPRGNFKEKIFRLLSPAPRPLLKSIGIPAAWQSEPLWKE